jgi:hypothetical protein
MLAMAANPVAYVNCIPPKTYNNDHGCFNINQISEPTLSD